MHMSRYFLCLLLLCALSLLSWTNKDTSNPVRWAFAAKPVKPNEFMLIFEAKVANNWYLYSQEVMEEALPTVFYFLPNESIEFTAQTMEEIGEPVQVKAGKAYKNQVRFTTYVRLKSEQAQLSGYVNYMTCDSEKCLPPQDVPFEFVFSH